ncbi:MBL fold metallo-hydrolase [Candidatus Kaiserbacteria bacterium]|nr:MBL fold metallo-hydrolase [Candidatus Kaiserbacteria bacterium]
MILTYHGGACVKASAGDTTIVLGPVSKGSKSFKPANFGANIAFISLNHPDMNGTEEVRGRPRKDDTEGAVNGAGKEPFIITGPGEYEVSDISAAGFSSGSVYGGHELINTIYSIHFDGLSVLYLGACGDAQLPKEVLEMDAPDVLILPVGGNGALSPADAQKVAVKLEAKIVIPILYDDKTLKTFLKEASSEDVKPVDKLTIKPRDLAGKESETIVLSV